jgi:hypothetical protein
MANEGQQAVRHGMQMRSSAPSNNISSTAMVSVNSSQQQSADEPNIEEDY